MTAVYQIGGMKTTSIAGYRWASASSLIAAAPGTKLLGENGLEFIVAGGTTFHIYQVILGNNTTVGTIIYLIYDDDGAGTNPVIVGTWALGTGVVVNLPAAINIPNGKHLIGKCASANLCSIFVAGVQS